jgi:hypothetical protein
MLRFANHKYLVAVCRYVTLHSTVNFTFALKIETMPELENKVAEKILATGRKARVEEF